MHTCCGKLGEVPLVYICVTGPSKEARQYFKINGTHPNVPIHGRLNGVYLPIAWYSSPHNAMCCPCSNLLNLNPTKSLDFGGPEYVDAAVSLPTLSIAVATPCKHLPSCKHHTISHDKNRYYSIHKYTVHMSTVNSGC